MNAAAVLSRVRELDVPAYGDDEVTFLANVLARHRPQVVFDWGTNVGASARIFYEAAQILGYPCVVHTIELPDSEAHLDRDHPGERYGQWLVDIPVCCWRGDALEVALKLLWYVDESLTKMLFFLDGAHDHDSVMRELRVIAAYEPEAVMVVHDTETLTGATVREFANQHPIYRVETLRSHAGMMALWPF